jgi:small subunit ribosomal protein S1
MVKNPQVVYDQAEAMAAKYREQMALAQQAASEAAAAKEEAVAEPEEDDAED